LVEVSTTGKWLSSNKDTFLSELWNKPIPIELLENYPKWLVGSRIFPVSDGGFFALGVSEEHL
jgi:hypothetical protein